MKYLSASLTAFFILVSLGNASNEDEDLIKEQRQVIIAELVPQEYSRDKMKEIVLAKNFVDPTQYDRQEFVVDHRAAYNWLKQFNSGELTSFANEFKLKTNTGRTVSDAEEGWTLALANYNVRIEECLKAPCSMAIVQDFAARGWVKQYNTHVVTLAAAYIDSIQPFVNGLLTKFNGK